MDRGHGTRSTGCCFNSYADALQDGVPPGAREVPRVIERVVCPILVGRDDDLSALEDALL